MSYLKRKYIDSHWLIFAIQGALALVFGWFTLFNPNLALPGLITVIGTFLLAMGILELFNILHRRAKNNTWNLSLAIAIVEVTVAIALLATVNEMAVWHLVVLALYVIARGIFELLIGLRSADDLTDRFIWAICGICGVIMGIVIFNAGAFTGEHSQLFVRFFGAYMLIFGLANLIYGVHNRDQKLEDKAHRSATAKKSTKKSAKKSSKRK